jgi:mono/diheme cytochrome c family protein
MAKVLIQVGAFGTMFGAEEIDHDTPVPEAPEAAVTSEYGKYLQSMSGCTTCHGAGLNGGKSPEPESPPGPNLTPGGNLANWTSEQFINTMRSGTTPEGHKMDPDFMPWKNMGKFNNTELAAMFAYFKSLPASESAVK